MRNRKVKNIVLITAAALALFVYAGYRVLFSGGVTPKGGEVVLFIRTGNSFAQVLESIDARMEIKNRKLFLWLAERKNYPSHIRSGRYVVDKTMDYVSFINKLRSGNQDPVDVTFNNIRSIYHLAGKIGGQIEADSAEIALYLSDPDNYKEDGFTRENVISVFIPNTYELYWNTDAAGFYSRMLKEYNRFWNKTRLDKARGKGLSPSEVSILASIIDDEVVKSDEKPRIAGVYLNRMKRGMPLQACPTIKFALNDFTITRVLNKHLDFDSPYNTYMHRGFPPGPIGCPTIEGIDAVLNAEKHDYLYFAAKADFSGYHNFSRTLTEHNRYANEYQRELDRRGIYR